MTYPYIIQGNNVVVVIDNKPHTISKTHITYQKVIDAIKAAGGVTKNADLSVINQARIIKDGEQIYIEKKIYGGGAKSVRKANGPLNINRATIKEFDALPGVGPVIAARIVEYRKVNGPFSTVDDLKKVPGIGGSKFEKFKEKIRV